MFWGPGRKTEFSIGLRWQVHDDQSVNPSILRVLQKPLVSVNKDRVVVPHQYQRSCMVFGTKLPHHRQCRDKCLTGIEGPPRTLLDRRPIGHRIAERHPEFDHVGPCTRQFRQNPHAFFGIRVARGDKCD